MKNETIIWGIALKHINNYMLIDKKTIKVIFEFEPENDTEKLAIRDLIGVNVVNAVTRFKTDKKTVEDALLFFQKINDIINIDDLLGN